MCISFLLLKLLVAVGCYCWGCTSICRYITDIPLPPLPPFSTLLLLGYYYVYTGLCLLCMWHMQGLFLLPSFSLHFLFSPPLPSLSGYLGERCKIGQKKDRLSLYTTLQGWPIGRIAQERKNKMQLFYFFNLPLFLFFRLVVYFEIRLCFISDSAI
ncbi:hypothetical protein F5X96DRAFT_648597 [Biscogniauxia mediterranea]|nr:hypothetical protein F5X96DRAFT_648597 [Biscogniauxia mediterranea]